MKTIVKIAAPFLIVIATLSIGLYFYFNPTPAKYPAQNAPILIAHGGGAIDGKIYTNSIEAVKNAIKNGYRYIELDLQLSADGYIFAAHDIESFNKQTNRESFGSKFPSIAEIKELKINGKYTPIAYEDINRIWRENPQLILVTDKIENFEALLSQIDFPNREERLLVEVFSRKNYKEALRLGVKYPMYCVWNAEKLAATIERIKRGQIAAITINADALKGHENLFEQAQKRGAAIFAFTTNDAAFIKSEFAARKITAFYTDFVTPNDL